MVIPVVNTSTFVYKNYLGDTKDKIVKSVVFRAGYYGRSPPYVLNFPEPVSEAQAIDEVQKYFSKPFLRGHLLFGDYNTLCRYDDINTEKPLSAPKCASDEEWEDIILMPFRGDVLGRKTSITKTCIDDFDGRMTITCSLSSCSDCGSDNCQFCGGPCFCDCDCDVKHLGAKPPYCEKCEAYKRKGACKYFNKN